MNHKNIISREERASRSPDMPGAISGEKKTVWAKVGEIFSGMSRMSRFLLNRQNRENWRYISRSHLFDASFYLEQYGELNFLFRKIPLIHYMIFGWQESRSPNPFFDIQFYLEDNPGVAQQPVNQLLHYMRHGAGEGRSPNRFFDPVYYRRQYELEDQSAWRIFDHFIVRGVIENYRPNPLFDPRFYAGQYPEYSTTDRHPMLHYQKKGVFAGNYPCREIAELVRKPLISIITPVYNTDEQLLRKCIHSVLFQAYPHWQLCLVDDGSRTVHVRQVLEEYAALDSRIKVSFLEENKGISTASNEAAALATGEYVGFLDHDDELTRDALYEVVKVINAENPDIIYSDEDLVNLESRYLESFQKPDYNAELLLCHNYITHFLVTKRSLFVETGGFSDRFSGAQDYDLFLKLTEKSRKTVHIPKILYHWRAHEASTSVNHQQKLYADEAGRKALAEALVRRKIDGTAERTELKFFYRVQRKSAGRPKISLICGTPGDDESFPSRVKKIVEFTDYADIEFILPGQSEEDGGLVLALSDVDAEVHLLNFTVDMTEVQWRNRAVEEAGGEVLLFFDLSQQPGEGKWLETLLGYTLRSEIGFAGGLIDSAADDILHRGTEPDISNGSWYYYVSFLRDVSVHLNGMHCPQYVQYVPVSLCTIERRKFTDLAGFDERYGVADFATLDLCLRLSEKGLMHVFTPYCRVRSGSDQRRRIGAVDSRIPDLDRELFQRRWFDRLCQGDPYYNRMVPASRGIPDEVFLRWYAGKNPAI